MEYQNIIKKQIINNIERTIDSTLFSIPVFNKELIPDGYCARYTRITAELLFNKKYPVCDAWEIRDDTRIIKSKKIDNLNEGDLMGCYYDLSSYNEKNRPYTHMLLFLKKIKQENIFAHLFGDETLISKQSELHDMGLFPKERLMLIKR